MDTRRPPRIDRSSRLNRAVTCEPEWRNVMLDRFFPRTIDHAYRGRKAALWLLGIVALMKMAMGFNTVVNGEYVLRSADGVPLDIYPAGAAQTIVAAFALWGWGLFIFALIAILALLRYRSMTPFVFLLLLTEHLGRKVILQFIPVVRSVTAPASWINTALLALMVAGLVLSLWQRRVLPHDAAPPAEA
jgi:hypothetical protein